MNDNNSQYIPDVSTEMPSDLNYSLERVGMRRIECPIQFNIEGQVRMMPAFVNAFVSLDKKEAKGIHMSRLFLSVTEALENNELSFPLLEKLLAEILDSHEGISETAELKISFDLPVKRKALLSNEYGWRQYPVTLMSRLNPDGSYSHRYGLEILYSSTCPCSAALSRDLIQKEFKDQFKEQKVDAEDVHAWLGKRESAKGTAHAQRSRAKLFFEVKGSSKTPLQYIDAVEESLGTPVQAAVKRIDEQEFARLNAEHLMFCEDSGRRLKALLEGMDEVTDYLAEVSHEESLHPHDAVSSVCKGVPGGMQIRDL